MILLPLQLFMSGVPAASRCHPLTLVSRPIPGPRGMFQHSHPCQSSFHPS